jgi:hypothetical protein
MRIEKVKVNMGVVSLVLKFSARASRVVRLALFDSISRPEWAERITIMSNNNMYQNYAYNTGDAEMQSLIHAVNSVKAVNEDAGNCLYKWIVAAQERDIADATIAKAVCAIAEKVNDSNVHAAMDKIKANLRKAAGQ